MALIVCELDGIGIPTTCTKKKGVRRVFAAQSSLIDWAAMLADAEKFSADDEQVLGYTYLTGGKHVELNFERKSGQFDSTFTRDTGAYDVVFQMIVEGKDRTRTNSLKRMAACCDLTLHFYMADGTQRVVGIDYDGAAFDRPLDKVQISRHLDSSGVFDGDESRDEIDFSGQFEFAPLHANVPIADMIAAATPALIGNPLSTSAATFDAKPKVKTAKS